MTASDSALNVTAMTPEPPSEKQPYPGPVPDWLEKGETPTLEQEREEVLRLCRIKEKERAEAKAKADGEAGR